MPISPISFGKIIKVQAPLNIVQQIAEMANDENLDDQLARETKSVFPDRSDGKVQQYGQYLLSGEESKTADIYYIAMPTQTRYQEEMATLIKNTGKVELMTVAHNGQSIKAIDMII